LIFWKAEPLSSSVLFPHITLPWPANEAIEFICAGYRISLALLSGFQASLLTPVKMALFSPAGANHNSPRLSLLA